MQGSGLSPQLQTEILKYITSAYVNEKTRFRSLEKF
jgi:hypothetical protein